MAFDFKKEYKEFYMPKNKPEIVNVPKANYIAVRGKGNPNEKDGAYQQAIGVLYAVAYTLKMSYKTDYKIDGFFEYVVPPLEGFWWQDDVDGIDYSNKDAFNWISVIRLPDFITKKDFDWAVETATKKKKLDCSSAEFITIEEGLCVQIMHFGAFDDEPATVEMMDTYLQENGYKNDLSKDRLHNEIYLSDARKVGPEKWKTVIRHPIKRMEYVDYKNSEAEKRNKRVRICNLIALLLIMAYMLLKDTGIYANNQVIRNGLNFAQGLAVGMLFSGIIMSSRYGAKVKAFKQPSSSTPHNTYGSLEPLSSHTL